MRRRDPLAVAAVLLAAVAFAGSFDHVRSVVDSHGQTGWLAWAIAAMPEVSVALAVLKVRRARTTGEATGWAWLVGTSAAAFTVSANLATAQPNPWGYVAAAWPAWASIGAFGLIEVGGSTPAPVAVEVVQVEPESALEAEVPELGTSPAAEVLEPVPELAPEPRLEPDPAPEVGREASQDDPPVTSGDVEPAPVVDPPARPVPVAAARQERGGTVTLRAVDDDPLLMAARQAADALTGAGKRVTRDNLVNALRDARHTCSNAKASELLKQLRETA